MGKYEFLQFLTDQELFALWTDLSIPDGSQLLTEVNEERESRRHAPVTEPALTVGVSLVKRDGNAYEYTITRNSDNRISGRVRTTDHAMFTVTDPDGKEVTEDSAYRRSLIRAVIHLRDWQSSRD